MWHIYGITVVQAYLSLRLAHNALVLHYVNVSVLIKFSQKTSIFTLIIISSP